MRNSYILDRGREKLVAYPEKRTKDRRGNSWVEYDRDKPITIFVHATTDRQSDAELTGQVAVKILKVACRIIPGVDSQSLVWFRGEYWDLAAPPKLSRVTRALEHMEMILRSRNQVAPDPTVEMTIPLPNTAPGEQP